MPYFLNLNPPSDTSHFDYNPCKYLSLAALEYLPLSNIQAAVKDHCDHYQVF